MPNGMAYNSYVILDEKIAEEVRENSKRKPFSFEVCGIPVGSVTKKTEVLFAGDKAGKVGVGTGKAAEVPNAIDKATLSAKKHMVSIPLEGTTIPHEVIGAFGAGRVLLKPAAPGTGVIAGGAVRAVVEMVGITDIRTKALRSNNPCNVVRATIQGLATLRSAEQVAAIRGKSVKEIVG